MSEKDEKKYACAALDEALRELRRPPAPRGVEFKIQTRSGTTHRARPTSTGGSSMTDSTKVTGGRQV